MNSIDELIIACHGTCPQIQFLSSQQRSTEVRENSRRRLACHSRTFARQLSSNSEAKKNLVEAHSMSSFHQDRLLKTTFSDSHLNTKAEN